MRQRALVAGVLSVAVLAVAYLLARREPVPALPDRAGPTEKPAAESAIDSAEAAASLDNGNAELAHAAGEIRAMPQTFRNSTFLSAIRRAGYYCDEVVSASESAEGGWVASCRDKGGYALSVRAIDRFDVRPIAHYFDEIGPRVIERDFEQR